MSIHFHVWIIKHIIYKLCQRRLDVMPMDRETGTNSGATADQKLLSKPCHLSRAGFFRLNLMTQIYQGSSGGVCYLAAQNSSPICRIFVCTTLFFVYIR